MVHDMHTSTTVPLPTKEACKDALNREKLKDVKPTTQTAFTYIKLLITFCGENMHLSPHREQN